MHRFTIIAVATWRRVRLVTAAWLTITSCFQNCSLDLLSLYSAVSSDQANSLPPSFSPSFFLNFLFLFFFFFIRWLEVSPKQKLTLFKQEGESWFYDVCPTRKGMAESGGERRKEREFCYLFINIMLVSICLFSDRRIYAIYWVLLALCPFHSCPYWANIVAYN